MILYKYFQPSDALPDPSRPLSASISPAVIKDANEAVRSATRSKSRGKYAKLIPEQQAVIGKYASLYGNQAAIHHFFKKLGVEIKVTLVHVHTKIKIRKFLYCHLYENFFIAIYTKICTSQNFPLYSTSIFS